MRVQVGIMFLALPEGEIPWSCRFFTIKHAYYVKRYDRAAGLINISFTEIFFLSTFHKINIIVDKCLKTKNKYLFML
jgi:hypothetical protein